MCVSITGPQTPTTTSNTDLITLAVDYLHFAGCYGRTGQTISWGINTASNNANLMRSVILQKGSTQDQPQCSVTHFFSKASLSGMKMRTDTFYRHWSAKAWLCLRISSGTLPSLSYSRVVFGPAPKSQLPLTRQVRSGNLVESMALRTRAQCSRGSHFSVSVCPLPSEGMSLLLDNVLRTFEASLPFLFLLQIWKVFGWQMGS